MSESHVATELAPEASPATEEHGHGHDHDDHHGHDPHVAHHFESMEQQVGSAKLGMWVFLSTELLMFGGLFCAYAMWRRYYNIEFAIGHQYLDSMMGAFNTVVLITSSFTMAWAVRTAMLGKKTATVVLLGITLLGGLGFMIVKYMEYSHKIHMGLFVGETSGKWEYFRAAEKAGLAGDVAMDEVVPVATAAGYMDTKIAELSQETIDQYSKKQQAHLAEHHDEKHDGDDHAKADASSHSKYPKVDKSANWYMVTPTEAANRHQCSGFFSIYYCMTGLHGLHVLIGMGLIGWIMLRAGRGEFSPSYNYPVDIVGLYWHLVDLIWIFLFPLLYLIH